MEPRDSLTLHDDGRITGFAYFSVDLQATPVQLESESGDDSGDDGDGDSESGDDSEAEADAITPQSYDPKLNEIDIAWYTGATVKRWSWDDGVYYLTLSMDPSHRQRLERLNNRAPLLNGHRSGTIDDQLGVIKPGSARIEGIRGLARVRMSSAPEDAGRVMKIATGIAPNASVGVEIHESQVTEAKDGQPKHVLATDWEPHEISSVPMGADDNAGTLAGDGRPPKLPTREPQNETGASTMPGTDETKAAVEAAKLRATTIMQLGHKHNVPPEKLQELVASDKSELQVRGEILDLRAAQDEALALSAASDAATGHIEGGQTEHQKRMKTVEEYLLWKCEPPWTDAKGKTHGFALTDGARQWFGYSALEICRADLRARRMQHRGMSRDRLAGHMLRPIAVELGREFQVFGTGVLGGVDAADLPSVMANVANKFLQAAWDREERTYEPWTGRMVLPDFKPALIAKLGSAPAVEDLLPDGTFQRGSVVDAGETIALVTGGKILPLTRRAIVNDDLGSLQRIPTSFGASTSDWRSRAVYSVLTENPDMLSTGQPFLSAAHNNIIAAGAGVTADVATTPAIEATWLLMRRQIDIENEDEDDTRIRVMPRFILHPTGQSVRWDQYYGAYTPNQPDDVVPARFRRFQLIDEILLDDHSPDEWYMIADPGRGQPAVMTATLEGNPPGPFLQWREGFETDGMELKVRDDFQASAAEERSIARNAGA